MRTVLAFTLGLLASVSLIADTIPADLATRLRGASRTVVGSVARLEPRMVRTPRGDRMIVTRTWLHVEEALKGRADSLLAIDVEGGTIGELSMRVSDIEPLKVGERAIVMMEPTADGAWRPHRRGLGLLRLTRDNRVHELGVSLADVRRLAAEVR